MSKYLINLGLIFTIAFSFLECNGQTIKGVFNYENAKPNMYVFSNFSSSMTFVLNEMDSVAFDMYYLDSEINLNSLKKEYKNYVGLDFAKSHFFQNSKDNLLFNSEKVWIEKTYYRCNLKTKKINYLFQILIVFNGFESNGTSASKRINKIISRKGKEIIHRDLLIRNCINENLLIQQPKKNELEIGK